MNIIDIIIIVIFLIYMIYGYNKGFIGSLMSLFSVIVSYILAYFLSRIIAPIITNNIIMPFFGDFIRQNVERSDVILNFSSDFDTLFTTLSQSVRDILLKFNIETSDQLMNIDNPLETLVLAMTESVAHTISIVVTFILIFILSTIIINILSSTLVYLTEILRLTTVNRLGGLLFGCVTAYLLVYCALFLIEALPYEFLESTEILSTRNLEDSIVLKMFFSEKIL